MGYNGLKLSVLAFLGRQKRPAGVPELAWAIWLPYDCRGLYPHLARYARWGLVQRVRGPDGRLTFWLTDRGRSRLAAATEGVNQCPERLK